MRTGRIWQIVGIVVFGIAAVAFVGMRVMSKATETAQATEAAAQAIDDAVRAVVSLDSLDVDVDSLRSQGVRVGGALGASLRAAWDTLAAPDTTGGLR